MCDSVVVVGDIEVAAVDSGVAVQNSVIVVGGVGGVCASPALAPVL